MEAVWEKWMRGKGTFNGGKISVPLGTTEYDVIINPLEAPKVMMYNGPQSSINLGGGDDTHFINPNQIDTKVTLAGWWIVKEKDGFTVNSTEPLSGKSFDWRVI